MDNSQEQYEALVQAQRKGFVKALMAIIGFVIVWKVCISAGIKTWGGGALNVALMSYFPTLYDWRSYELTKKFSPLFGWIFNFLIIVVPVIIFNLGIDLLGIPQ